MIEDVDAALTMGPALCVNSTGFDLGGVSVVVCTSHRVGRLASCLAGLRAQARPADEVIVVAHTADDESAAMVGQLSSRWPELSCVRVAESGLVAAYNCGFGVVSGEIVAFVDDDAVPSPDWLKRIVETFGQDERIAAVGGRDVCVWNGKLVEAPQRFGRRGRSPTVGRIQWFGRMLGNHHVGMGEARDVDLLKGVNMSFRRSSVLLPGFDPRLKGRGAQLHSELSICLPLKREGRRVVYDPAIVVNHFPAPRASGDQRADLDPGAVFAAAHNEALAILDYFGPFRRLVYMVWGLSIGITDAPGLAVMVRDLLTGKPDAGSRFRAAQRGRAAAWRTWRTPRGRIETQENTADGSPAGHRIPSGDRTDRGPGL